MVHESRQSHELLSRTVRTMLPERSSTGKSVMPSPANTGARVCCHRAASGSRLSVIQVRKSRRSFSWMVDRYPSATPSCRSTTLQRAKKFSNGKRRTLNIQCISTAPSSGWKTGTSSFRKMRRRETSLSLTCRRLHRK